MADPVNWTTVLLSAVGGATAGGVVNIAIGSTKAEREERGKRRIQAREELGQALRTFRFTFANARLARLEEQDIKEDELLTTAIELGIAARRAARLFAPLERKLTVRRISRLIGDDLLTVAAIRPEGSPDATDAATVIATARYRRVPGEAVLDLVRDDPLDPAWDTFMTRIDRLARRYS